MGVDTPLTPSLGPEIGGGGERIFTFLKLFCEWNKLGCEGSQALSLSQPFYSVHPKTPGTICAQQ